MADFIILEKESIRISSIDRFTIEPRNSTNERGVKGIVKFYMVGESRNSYIFTPTLLSHVDVANALNIASKADVAMDFLEAVEKIS